jgi:altronate hydrolase
LRRFNVDGVVALTHGSGAAWTRTARACSSFGAQLAATRGTRTRGRPDDLAGLQANQISSLMSAQNLQEGPLLRTFSIQDTGGTAKTIAYGIGIIEEMLPHANVVTRQPVPRRTSPSACNAAGRMVIRASPPIPRWAPPWTARAQRRHGDPVGDARNLRRRAPADAARRFAGRRRKLISRIKWWEEYTTREKGEMNNNRHRATRRAA